MTQFICHIWTDDEHIKCGKELFPLNYIFVLEKKKGHAERESRFSSHGFILRKWWRNSSKKQTDLQFIAIIVTLRISKRKLCKQ